MLDAVRNDRIDTFNKNVFPAGSVGLDVGEWRLTRFRLPHQLLFELLAADHRFGRRKQYVVYAVDREIGDEPVYVRPIGAGKMTEETQHYGFLFGSHEISATSEC